MKTLGKVEKTERGFERIDFKDFYGEACSLQKSSLATEDAIWLGCEESKVHHVTKEPLSPRMHLNREQVLALVAHLQNWINRDTFKIQ
jgi:hypothetical protein